MLSNFTTSLVFIGVALLGINAAFIGTYNFLQKKSLLSDVVAHSILPGICLAFIFSGEKNFLLLLLGALLSGSISIVLIDTIKQKSYLKEDAIMGIILSFFFGLGIVLLTYIQNSNYANQSGLNSFLLGKAAALLPEDVYVISFNTLIIVVFIILFGRLFYYISFDRAYIEQVGVNVKLIQLVLNTLTILTITIGIQAVGIVLIAAIMIIPPAIATLWAFQINKILLYAALASVLASLLGTYISYKYEDSPTGPWIVVFLFVIFLVSLFLGKQSKLYIFK